MRKILGAWLAGLIVVAGSLAGASPAVAAGAVAKGHPSASANKSTSTRLLTTNYFYNVARQSFGAGQGVGGVDAQNHVRKPAVDSATYHSLAELSAQRGGNIVEIGWTVDPALNGGSAEPHLFVYWWKNGVGQGYNVDCVDNAANPVNAGASLAAAVGGTQKRFTIQNVSGNWWMAYDGAQVCHFPGSLWTSPAFTSADLVQGFGEVATTAASPCADMGNGIAASARIGSLNLTAPLTPATLVPNFTMTEQPVTGPNIYDISILSNRTMAYGGPGFC